MGVTRRLALVRSSIPTVEGAGVHLRRAFGSGDIRMLDPFLLLDDFRSHNPDDYMAGFPWHPHRGIETITYILDGGVEHQDSMGNTGILSSGDAQWMTAGSGIMHQEMPKIGANKAIEGFQLWANLPGETKMMDPRYQDISADAIPSVEIDGVRVRVIAGEAGGQTGPVSDIVIDPVYFDVTIPPGSEFKQSTPRGHTVAAYIYEGSGDFSGRDVGGSLAERTSDDLGDGTLLVFEDGDEIRVRTADFGVRFILFAGRPLGEPIAWAGPIVMNSKAELVAAFDELDSGTFVKQRGNFG